MDIFLLRHGETHENQLGVVQGSGIDGSLNAKGRRQALSFYKSYKNEGFDKVFSSKLKRSIETVSYFIDDRIPWEQRAELNEINWGEHEGQNYNPQLIANYKELIENWKNGKLDARLPGGESAKELIERTDRFIESLQTLSCKKVLICSHGRTIRCLLCRFLELDIAEMENFRHYNTGLFRLKRTNGSFQLQYENNVSHLQKDLLPRNQNF